MAARGNGINPDSIKIKELTGQVAEFAASTSLIVRQRTMERVVGGKKPGGERVEGPQGLKDALERERQRILSSADISAKIKNLMLERKDKGFGTRNEIIKLPFLTKDYVHYQGCKNCNAQGQIKCQRCVGKGYETCPRCNGQSMEICSQCRGAQLIFNGNTKVPCPKCNGQGRTPCAMCNQTRKIPCSACRTKGAMQCQTCNGQAWHSYITTAEIDVLASFSYDRQAVPQRLISILETRAKDIPLYGDVTVVFTQADAQAQEALKPDEILLKYRVDIPFAEAQISLGKEKIIPAFLLGRTAEIADIPNFLDTLLKPGMDILQEAAEGRGNVARKIHRAARYRTIRQAIAASAKYSNVKAARYLEKNTPLGLSKNVIRTLVVDADRAIKNITAKPRRNGVIAGNIFAALLFLIYMGTGLRGLAIQYIPEGAARIALDGFVLGTGMFIAILTIQLFSSRAVRKALGKLLPANHKDSFMPQSGYNGLWSALLCLAMFLIACEISAHLQGSPPEWYVMMRERFL